MDYDIKESKERFARRLAGARHQTGLSVEIFAAMGGVKKQDQIKFESGERLPDAEYLMRLNKAGINAYWLVAGNVLPRHAPYEDHAFLGKTSDHFWRSNCPIPDSDIENRPAEDVIAALYKAIAMIKADIRRMLGSAQADSAVRD